MGHVMLDLLSPVLTQVEKELIEHPQAGGIILFSRNYESKKQLRRLIKAIRSIKENILIAVDQEGGRVQRFKDEFTTLPAFRSYGEMYGKNKSQALGFAKQMAYTMAKELLDCGIDMSFSPVLDIDHGQSEVIGDRSFHQDVNIVTNLAGAFITGMHEAGMSATGKHFPGHGAVSTDSHHTLPVDQRTFTEIEHVDLQPFYKLSQVLDGIMPAHILYKQVDDQPTCFSAKWLQDILRKRINFQGVIFSDDLSMAGAECIADYRERAEKALVAGCDMVLVCNHREAAIQVLLHLEKYQNPESASRIEFFRTII